MPVPVSALSFDVLLSALDRTEGRMQIWDAHERLVYANAASWEVSADLGIDMRLGMDFRDFVRAAMAAGAVPDSGTDADACIDWHNDLAECAERSCVWRLPGDRWALVRHRRLPDGGTVTTAHDITEQKRSEQSLRESDQRFRDFVSASTDRFWETDRDLRFTMLTDMRGAEYYPPSEKMLGHTRDELFADDPEGDPNWIAYRETLSNRRPFRDFRYRITNPDGETRQWRVSGVPFFDQAGQFCGYRGTSTDETEWRRDLAAADEKLYEALRRAEAASEAKSLFLATVSHELRTPLNAVIGFAELLKYKVYGPLGDPRYDEYASNIYDSAWRLLGLIQDILDLSGMQTGDVELRENRVDIAAEIAAIADILGSEEVGRGPVIQVSVPKDLPPVWADRRMLHHTLYKLMSNAVKFTAPEGRVEVTVTAGDGLAIAVADEGIGIAPEHIEKILEPFEIVDNSLTRNHDGAGLGLPLAKTFVELHDGTFEIESAVGKGTMVTIRLPRHRLGGPDGARKPSGRAGDTAN